jgi:hypothetical protein
MRQGPAAIPAFLTNPPEAVTRVLDGRHHLERFAMEQAGEVDYMIDANFRGTEPVAAAPT